MPLLGFDDLDNFNGPGDVVVIGSGFAGQAVASRLAAYDLRVLLLEQGSQTDLTAAGDESYELEITGLPYPRLGSRLASFGGTSNHWNGESHPLSARIFERRQDAPGWPISYRDFAAYLPDAAAWLRVSDFDDGQNSLQRKSRWDGYLGLATDGLRNSYPIVRLGTPEYLHRMRVSSLQFLMSDVRVTKILLNEESSRVDALDILHQPSGRRKRLKVANAILCCGGIEVARLFLWAARLYRPGSPLDGGPRRQTGKFFMEHPHIVPCDVYYDAAVDLRGTRGLRPSDELIDQHNLARFGVFFRNQGQEPDANDTLLLSRADMLFAAKRPAYLKYTPTFIFEQRPLAESRVTLSERTDSTGVPLARLHWAISESDFDSYRRSILAFAGLLSQHGLARVFIRDQYRGTNYQSWKIFWGCHHLGTTRMAGSPDEGVVDTDCRVFGLQNCYVVGSSLFPTGDYVNPTLNLVALAYRFAERFRTRYMGQQ